MQNLILESTNKEAGWLKGFRKKSFESFNNLPLEQSSLFTKYTDENCLNLEKFSQNSKKSGEIPEYLKDSDSITLIRNGSNIFISEINPELKKYGIIFTDIITAIEKCPNLIKRYLLENMKSENKLESFNSAFFSNGIFLYVPKNVNVKIPFRSISLEDRQNISSRNIIIADPQSYFTFIEENYSLTDNPQPSLFTNFTEIFLGENSQVVFGGLQNLGSNVTDVDIKKCFCENNSQISWNLSMFGGKFTKSQVDSVLKGNGSTAIDNQIIFGDKTQKFDIMSNLIHTGESTTGRTRSKGVMKDSANAVMKGMIDINKNAKNSNAYLAEYAMLLSKDAKADTIPSLEIKNKDVKATHSASVSQVNEDQIFYLMSRGLSENDARKTLVYGFFEPLIQTIPLSHIRKLARSIVDSKWKGEKMSIPSKEFLSSLEDHIEDVQEKDIFSGHYKYR
ncbi:MAG: Fe-S cluster assembly protein SufD [Candidatus Aenigmarchaeota archaeon]|nr:Fe-S cluster assembly protein SufD [Candidatus Aenigmarchaeota archaeon]